MDDVCDATHGVVVRYNNSGAELTLARDSGRLSIRAADDSEGRIISSRDSSVGRLITMSRDFPKVALNGRYHVMDRSWPALLTMLVRNKMRLIDVLLHNRAVGDDGREHFDVRPWSNRDRTLLEMVTACAREGNAPSVGQP